MRTATSRRWRTSPCPGCWNTTCWSRWIWRCWRKGQCELLKFGVKEAYRGRGIGTALMEAALQAARDAGQKKAVLTSNHQLREALRLYERFGFKYVTYSDKWFQLSDIRMEREL